MTPDCIGRGKDYRFSFNNLSPASQYPDGFITVDSDADHTLRGYKVQYQDPRFMFQISDSNGYPLSDQLIPAQLHQNGWGPVGSQPDYLFQACTIGVGCFARVTYPHLWIAAGSQIRVSLTIPTGLWSTSPIKFIFHTVKRFTQQ